MKTKTREFVDAAQLMEQLAPLFEEGVDITKNDILMAMDECTMLVVSEIDVED